MPPKVTSQKKSRLTLAQLASYDDILTDALVDHVYFWTNIRKNRSAYHSCRGVREEDITAILQKSVVINKNPAEGEAQLLALAGLKKFSDNLKTEKEKEDFRQHLRRYINIYLPECSFEVTTTNRYTVVTHEAAVTARRFIKKGEVIKYLCGIQVVMTPEEEEFIQRSRRDFSIVVSSRNKHASLFLGPARFANHDCGANAELITGPNQSMMIKAKQDIETGEEITVTYGDNYFGENNCECLCKNCEDNSRNGWSNSGDAEVTPKLSIEGQAPGFGYSLRRRRNATPNSSRNQSETPEVNIRPWVPKSTPKSTSRFKNVESSLGLSPPAEPIPVKRKRDFESLTPSNSQPAKRAKIDNPVKEEEASITVKEELLSIKESMGFNEEARLSPSPPSSSAQSRPISSRSSPSEGATSTDATSVDEDTIVVEQKSIATVMSDPKSSPGDKLALSITSNISNDHTISIQDDKPDLDSSMELDESSMTVTSKKGTKRKRRLPIPTTDLDHAPAVRIRGDYVLTPALLGEPASAWVNCKICEEPFVQKDAYCTRSSCPRCERHSKLYGYMWPKTDKEGRNDTEERVLDHRTVHRFIRPSEERVVRKRGRSSTGSPAVAREVSAVASEKSEPPKRRGGRRKA